VAPLPASRHCATRIAIRTFRQSQPLAASSLVGCVSGRGSGQRQELRQRQTPASAWAWPNCADEGGDKPLPYDDDPEGTVGAGFTPARIRVRRGSRWFLAGSVGNRPSRRRHVSARFTTEAQRAQRAPHRENNQYGAREPFACQQREMCLLGGAMQRIPLCSSLCSLCLCGSCCPVVLRSIRSSELVLSFIAIRNHLKVIWSCFK